MFYKTLELDKISYFSHINWFQSFRQIYQEY